MKKYFDGPAGIYYNWKTNRIFLLSDTNYIIYNAKLNKIIGKEYKVESEFSPMNQVRFTSTFQTNTIYLGEI